MTASRRRQGFSLIELMIAIVILGLGMVMVATVFPIAIGRARQLTDVTRSDTIATAAESMLDTVIRVAGPSQRGTSLVGDIIIGRDPVTSTNYLIAFSDTRVHALHMENVTMSPRRIVPGRSEPWTETEATWHADPPDFHSDLLTAPILFPTQGQTYCDYGVCGASFFGAQVRVEDRIYPPIRGRADVNSDGDLGPGDELWDDLLDTRRYAWSALHRLNHEVGPRREDSLGVDAITLAQQAASDLNEPRTFDFYYVLLRRSNPTLRYARQDPTFAPNVYPSGYDGTQLNYRMTEMPTVAPKALPPEFDVMLPEPWRVQVQLPDTIVNRDNASGLPTEVEVPPRSAVEDLGISVNETTMLGEMFQRGTRFVDELNGQVYRVVTRRLKAMSQEGHFGYVLTLDREILQDEIEVTQENPILPCPDCVNGVLDAEERLRTVWVFPPPVARERLSPGVVIYDGPDPVIEIRVKTKTFAP